MRNTTLYLAFCLLSVIISSSAISCNSSSLPELQVSGNHFVDSDGNTVVLRGVSICAPGFQKSKGQWNDKCFRTIAEWGANVVRIPAHPDELRQMGYDAYFDLIDEGVTLAGKHGLYVIIDWHCIGNLVTETMADNFPMTIAETREFWRKASEHWCDNNTVAVFEIFNEPTTGDVGELGECTWHDWRLLSEEIIDDIRVAAPRKICLVGGLDWAFDLSEIGGDPIQRDNIAYSCHPYPQKCDFPWVEEWDEKFGYLSESYPIVCTEVGWSRPGEPGACNPAITNEPYGQIITDYFDKHGISFTAWCFDPESGPIIVKNWDYEPNEAGEIIRDYMLRKAAE